MVKHKIISKYGITKYYIKGRRGQQLEENAIQKIRAGAVRGLLPIEVNRKSGSFQLIYDVTGFMVFSSFMEQVMTRAVFVAVIRNIVQIFTDVPAQHMDISKIEFDYDSIFVNPSTNRLFFIYVPVCDCDNGMTIRDLLLRVSSSLVFSKHEDNSYVGVFMKYVNENSNISKVELNQLLDSIEGKSVVLREPGGSGEKRCPNCNGIIGAGDIFCKSCGKKIADGEENAPNTYNPICQTDHSGGGKTAREDVIREWKAPKNAGRSENRTTVLQTSLQYGEDSEGTTVLAQNSFPFLIRKYSGEKIRIDRSPFKIGKEKRNCNYYVADNSAVSRDHADIISENGVFFIIDNGSTNFTYLDGRRIAQHQKVEIVNETQLRLANEDFTFFVPEGGRS